MGLLANIPLFYLMPMSAKTNILHPSYRVLFYSLKYRYLASEHYFLCYSTGSEALANSIIVGLIYIPDLILIPCQQVLSEVFSVWWQN